MKIKQAETESELEEVRTLFREYEQFLNVDLCFQGFEEELSGLPGKYAPPSGSLLIGSLEDQIVGCVALRKLEEGVCEMKRLYVRPEARGSGLGKELAGRIIADGKASGYRLMRLDTLEKLEAAMGLYERLGFKKRDPYYHNPLPGAVFWELDLMNTLLRL